MKQMGDDVMTYLRLASGLYPDSRAGMIGW